MAENLRKKTLNGIIWSYIGRFGNLLMGLIPSMILARLLGPEQYGLIAMAGIFTGIAYMLSDGGFGNALVQKHNADQLDYCTVFYFNIGICGVIYTILFFGAPLIAEFFKEPQLTAIVRVSSLGVIIIAFGQIQSLQFKKDINYKTPVIRGFIAQMVSVTVAIIMAYRGLGVWALVAQGLTQTFLSVVINWIISTWRPTWVFSFARLRRLFSYGSKTLASSIIDYGFGKAYDIIIGRFYTPASLGLYNRGYQTAGIFRDTFFSVFSGVTFPVFVKMQDDDERLKSNIRKFLMIITLMIFSVMSIVLVLGEPLFIFMYSTKWLAAVPLFRVACIVCMLVPIVSILESVILAKGHSGKFLMISIIRKFFVVAVVLSVWTHGVIWLMVGQAVVNLIEITIYMTFLRRLVRYGYRQFVSDVFPSMIMAILTVIPVVLVDYVLANNLLQPDYDEMITCLIRLCIGGLVGITSFIVINRIFRPLAYRELVQFLEDTVGNKKFMKLLR